jgi:hypothetical protein
MSLCLIRHRDKLTLSFRFNIVMALSRRFRVQKALGRGPPVVDGPLISTQLTQVPYTKTVHCSVFSIGGKLFVLTHPSSAAFTVASVHVVVFWAVTPFSLLGGYPCFGGKCCLHLQSRHGVGSGLVT